MLCLSIVLPVDRAPSYVHDCFRLVSQELLEEVCKLLSVQPQQRLPKDQRRDPAVLFRLARRVGRASKAKQAIRARRVVGDME